MKRKDFIRNMVMGFAATLLPKTLWPSDPYAHWAERGLKAIEKYKDDSLYQITYDTGHGSYTYWASGKMLNAMEREHYKMFKYYGRKKDW